MKKILFGIISILFFMTHSCNASGERTELVNMTDSTYIRAALSNEEYADYSGRYRKKNLVLFNSKVGGYAAYNLNKKYEKFTGTFYMASHNNRPFSRHSRNEKNRVINIVVKLDGKINDIIENLAFRKKIYYEINLKSVKNMEIFVVDKFNKESGLIRFKDSDFLTYDQAIFRDDIVETADLFIHDGIFREHKHNFTGMQRVKEPSCTEKGIEENRCSSCGVVVESKYIQQLGHKKDNKWVKTRERTCNITGQESILCTVCNNVVETRELPKLPHKYNKTKAIVLKEATCASEGLISRICEICNNTIEETIPSTEHNVVAWKTIKGSVLDNPVVKVGRCSVCGKEVKINDNRYYALELLFKLIIAILALAIVIYFTYLRPKGYRIINPFK